MTVSSADRESEAVTLAVPESLGKFKRLRLAVRETGLSIEKLTVAYASGSSKSYAVTGALLADGVTPWFEIDPGRFIKAVNLKLREKTPATAPPRIELHGELADGWLSANGEGKKFNDGWVLIGAQPAGFIGFDDDVIAMAKQEEGFEKIRVKVRGRPVTLNQLRVVYANGEEDIVPVRSRIDPGDAYGPISVRGTERKIREIRARYRSRVIDEALQDRGPAVVQVWAKR